MDLLGLDEQPQPHPDARGDAGARRRRGLPPPRPGADRKRAVELFDFEFGIEIYTPAARRRWGCYALPVLHGDRLVGKVDATADRDAGVLRVDALHEDVTFAPTIRDGVDAELDSLARWLDHDRVHHP